MDSEYKTKLLIFKLMLINLLLLHTQCHCYNISVDEGVSQESLYETFPMLENSNNTNSVIWTDIREGKGCISLASSRISISLNHQSNSNKNTHSVKNVITTKRLEIDLISLNTTTTPVQVEGLCSFHPKLLKISFSSSSSPEFDGELKFYFLTQPNSYRLVLVDLLVNKQIDDDGALKTRSSYFAFRSVEDYRHKNETVNQTEFGRSSYCGAWRGVDTLAETWIQIENLQYEVRKDGQFLNDDSDSEEDVLSFSPIGSFCTDDDNSLESPKEDESLGWWDDQVVRKTPFYKFLLNIMLLLGGCGILIGAIFGLCKFCPSKVKQMRKSVFQV